MIDKKISQLGDTWKDTKLHVEELIKQLQSNVEVNSPFTLQDIQMQHVEFLFAVQKWA